MLKDITSREDIEKLVNRFYEQVREDELLAPVFLDLDWPKHLPVMYNFWASMILGEQSYVGNPFQKHVQLPIRKAHFQRWLDLFVHTVDDNFRGEQAEEIKNRARSIAQVFQYKLGLLANT